MIILILYLHVFAMVVVVVPICICNGNICGSTKKVLKLQQDQRLMTFLMKLDDQYGSVKTNILMLPELPNVSTTYHMLYQEQKYKELARIHNSASSDSMAFNVNKKYAYDRNHSTNRFYKHNIADNGEPRLALASNATPPISVSIVKYMVILLRGVLNSMVIHLVSSKGNLLVVFRKLITKLILKILVQLLLNLIISWLC